MSALIYVIEDEADIARLEQYHLSIAGHQVESYLSGETGFEAIERQVPDLVLLDLMLPGLNGLEICQKIKSSKKYKDIAVIMVTAKGEEKDIVQGLEMGADDYVTKPFSPKILVSRVNSVLRRTKTSHPDLISEELLVRGNLQIHLGRHEVKCDNKVLDLTQFEFKILIALAKKPGWVFTRGQLIEVIHGDNYAVTDRSVDFQIVGLRKKLGSASSYVETVRGIGYRFQESPEV